MPKARRLEDQRDPETGKISKGDRTGTREETLRAQEGTAGENFREAIETPGLEDTGLPSDALNQTDLAATRGPATERLLDASEQAARDEFAARQTDFDESRRVLGDADDAAQTGVTKIDEEAERLTGVEAEVMARLRSAAEQIQGIPDAVTTEFDRLRGEFDTLSQGAFDRLDSQQAAAVAGIQEGKNAALSAAVNGIQGNINQAIAQIQSDPNMTSAQKASMISRARMSGAMALAPAVGAHVLEFNKLTANTRTSFAQIGAQVQTQILGTQGDLIGAQGNAFAAAQTAVGQLTTQLLATEANTAVQFANAQTQLVSSRAMITNANSSLQLQGISEFGTPFLNLTDTRALELMAITTLVNDIDRQSLSAMQFNINANIAIEQEGEWPANIGSQFFSDLAQGDFAGAALGAFFGLAQGPPQNTVRSTIDQAAGR